LTISGTIFLASSNEIRAIASGLAALISPTSAEKVAAFGS